MSIDAVKKIERLKGKILDLEGETNHLLAALKGAEFVLLQRQAAEKEEHKINV